MSVRILDRHRPEIPLLVHPLYLASGLSVLQQRGPLLLGQSLVHRRDRGVDRERNTNFEGKKFNVARIKPALA
jgi:hypothetical protein